MSQIKLIKPNEGECIFESYLSVLVEILGEENIYKIINKYVPVVKIDFRHRDTPWKDPETYGMEKFIFYICNKKLDRVDETHYMVAIKKNKIIRNRIHSIWEILNPYHYYQKYASHGFCQMFAHFIANNKTNGLIHISQAKGPNLRKELYKINTYRCLRKTLRLIKKKSNLQGYMEYIFEDIKLNEVERIKFGIDKKMKFHTFIEDLHLFDLDSVTEYIDDLY
jgi:hypothetical protein